MKKSEFAPVETFKRILDGALLIGLVVLLGCALSNCQSLTREKHTFQNTELDDGTLLLNPTGSGRYYIIDSPLYSAYVKVVPREGAAALKVCFSNKVRFRNTTFKLDNIEVNGRPYFLPFTDLPSAHIFSIPSSRVFYIPLHDSELAPLRLSSVETISFVLRIQDENTLLVYDEEISCLILVTSDS